GFLRRGGGESSSSVCRRRSLPERDKYFSETRCVHSEYPSPSSSSSSSSSSFFSSSSSSSSSGSSRNKRLAIPLSTDPAEYILLILNGTLNSRSIRLLSRMG